MRARGRAAAALVALLVAAFALGGGARSAAARGNRRHRAKRLFRYGERAYEAGRFKMAARAFDASYRLLPLPAIAFSAAQAYRLEYFARRDPRSLKRAVELYRLYVKKVKHGGRRPDAVAMLGDLEPLLRSIEERHGQVGDIAMGHATTLYVSSQVKGARGSFDGGSEHALPFDKEVKPGLHRITVHAKGYVSMTRRVLARAGQPDSVDFELKPKPARVSLSTEEGADIAVDGRPAGMAPLEAALALSPGTHRITVTRRGRRPFSRDIHVARAERLSLPAPLATTTQRRISYWVLGAAAATLASAGVTGALAFAADRHAATLETTREQTGLTAAQFADYEASRNRRNSRLQATYVLGGIGAALAAGGAALFFFDHPRPEAAPAGGVGAPARAVSVAPMTGTTGAPGAGVVVLGRF